MEWTSILAIYALFWVICGFIVLPIGIRTHDELGHDKIPGQADSAPANFRPGRKLLWTTLLASLLFGIFYANYEFGWITPADLDVFGSAEKFG